MTNRCGRFEVELTSVPDRDDLVAEVWFGEHLFAELRHEPDGVKAQFYAAPAGRWDVPYDELASALDEARERLGPPPTRG